MQNKTWWNMKQAFGLINLMCLQLIEIALTLASLKAIVSKMCFKLYTLFHCVVLYFRL